MKEIWKDIKGYYKLYQVSTRGKIRSLDRVVTDKNGNKKILKGKVRSKTLDKDGYVVIALYKKGKERNFKVHRLVAQAFIPNPLNLPEVNHKKPNKKNNCVSNLEWCTGLDNIAHIKRYRKRNKKAKEELSTKIRAGHIKFYFVQYSRKGRFIKRWKSLYDVILKNPSFKQPTIRNAASKIKPTAYGYIWEKVLINKNDR